MLIVLRFHSLLIIKVYYKMRQVILQNATAILVENAIKVYHKMRQVFLLQNATVLLQKSHVYCKLR